MKVCSTPSAFDIVDLLDCTFISLGIGFFIISWIVGISQNIGLPLSCDLGHKMRLPNAEMPFVAVAVVADYPIPGSNIIT